MMYMDNDQQQESEEQQCRHTADLLIGCKSGGAWAWICYPLLKKEKATKVTEIT